MRQQVQVSPTQTLWQNNIKDAPGGRHESRDPVGLTADEIPEPAPRQNFSRSSLYVISGSSNATIIWWTSLTSKLTLLEISGSCGDFGTLFPLLVALARDRKIHLAPTLLLTGVVHIATGTYWNLPMPLQPMHMISAQAISDALTREQVTIAGMGMGLIFGVLSFGGIEFLHRVIPYSVIGGLQLGVGWKLALKALGMIQNLPWWGVLDCKAVGIASSVLILWSLGRTSRSSDQEFAVSSCFKRLMDRPPMGIVLFLVGLALAGFSIAQDPSKNIQTESESLFVNALGGATWKDVSKGLLDGTLPQLPLTLLNSCLSVCVLAHTIFPEHTGNPVSHKSVSRSLSLMNTILCPLGMMPHCHGAGGLAVQHRLGARSGASMIALGAFKLVLSLLAAQGGLLVLLDALPVSILCVLLALSGHELAMTGVKSILQKSGVRGGDQQLTHDATIALVTGLVIVGTGKADVGSLCGWLTYMIYGQGLQELCGITLSRRNQVGSEYGPQALVEDAEYSPLNLDA